MESEWRSFAVLSWRLARSRHHQQRPRRADTFLARAEAALAALHDITQYKPEATCN